MLEVCIQTTSNHEALVHVPLAFHFEKYAAILRVDEADS